MPIARIAPVLDGEPVTDNNSNGIAMSCACVPTNDITPPPAKSAKFLSRQRSNPDLHCFIALSDFHAPYAQLVELPDLRRAQHPWPGHPERKEAPYLVINRRFRHRGDEQTHTVPNSSSRARGTAPLPDRLSDRFLRWVPVVPLPASSSTGLVRGVILRDLGVEPARLTAEHRQKWEDARCLTCLFYAATPSTRGLPPNACRVSLAILTKTAYRNSLSPPAIRISFTGSAEQAVAPGNRT